MGECTDGKNGPCLKGRWNSETKGLNSVGHVKYALDWYTRNRCPKSQDADQCERTYFYNQFNKQRALHRSSLSCGWDYNIVDSPKQLKKWSPRYYRAYFDEACPPFSPAL
jgi:hypothetical protein